MKSILYISNAQISFSETELHDLANLSACKNRQLDITGYLNFSGNRFMQYIEGNPFLLDSLMNKIRQDDRHQILYETEREGLHYRVYPDWDMQLFASEDKSLARLEKGIENNLIYLCTNSLGNTRFINVIWQQLRTLAAIKTSKQMLHQSMFASKVNRPDRENNLTAITK